MFLSYSKRVFFEELNSLFSQDVGTLFNTSAAEGHSSFLTLETSVDKSLPSQLKIDENSSGCVLVHFKECFWLVALHQTLVENTKLCENYFIHSKAHELVSGICIIQYVLAYTPKVQPR